MKVGDLVKLSTCETRRGYSYENKIGIVIAKHENIYDFSQQRVADFSWITVNFAGEILRLQSKKLVTVYEGR